MRKDRTTCSVKQANVTLNIYLTLYSETTIKEKKILHLILHNLFLNNIEKGWQLGWKENGVEL